MKRFISLLLIGSLAILGLSGCSAPSEEPEPRETVEVHKTKEEITEEETTASPPKGLAVSSLTLCGKTLYLETTTLRELVIFLQNAGYTCESLGAKLKPGKKDWVTLSSSEGAVISLTIYNPKNEEITYSDCKISDFYIPYPEKTTEDLYVLNGLVNTRSGDRDVAQAFEQLGIEYRKTDSLMPPTAAPDGSTTPTPAENESKIFIAAQPLTTGQEVQIEIDKLRNGARTISISLPILYE